MATKKQATAPKKAEPKVAAPKKPAAKKAAPAPKKAEVKKAPPAPAVKKVAAPAKKAAPVKKVAPKAAPVKKVAPKAAPKPKAAPAPKVAPVKKVVAPKVKADVFVWGLKTCGTTKKAMKFAGERAKMEEISKISKALLSVALKNVEAPAKLFNTSGESYKKGDFKSKVKTMKTGDIVKAMMADPMLIKRPIVKTKKGVVVGFDEAKLKAIL